MGFFKTHQSWGPIPLVLFLSLSSPTFGQTTWTAQEQATPGSTRQLNSVAWDGSKFVAVGNAVSFATSADGFSWQFRTLSPFASDLNDIVWNGSKFVSVGTSGAILSSEDGSNWTIHPYPASIIRDLFGVAWSGTYFAAVGTALSIVTSQNGSSWTEATTIGITSRTLRDIVWNGTFFLFVGDSGAIGFSTFSDGEFSWTAQNLGSSQGINRVTWNGTDLKFLAVTDTFSNGTVSAKALISSDGNSWLIVDPFLNLTPTPSATPPSVNFNDVLWTGSDYAVIGDQGVILRSSNGTGWKQDVSGTTNNLNGIGLGGTTLVAVGGKSETTPTPSPTPIPTATGTATPNPTNTPTPTPTASFFESRVIVTSSFSGSTPTPTPTIVPTPAFTPIMTVSVSSSLTPISIATFVLTLGELADTDIFYKPGEFTGATITISSIINPPQSLSLNDPVKSFAIKISKIEGCSSGIRIDTPVPGSISNPVLAVYIGGTWISLTTTVSGGRASAIISCSQIAAARATSKEIFGQRVASNDVIVGLLRATDFSTATPTPTPQPFIVPAFGFPFSLVLILVLSALLAFYLPRSKRS